MTVEIFLDEPALCRFFFGRKTPRFVYFVRKRRNKFVHFVQNRVFKIVYFVQI